MRVLEGQIAWAAARVRACKWAGVDEYAHAQGMPRVALTRRACLTSQALLERLRKTPVNGVKFKGSVEPCYAHCKQAAV